MTLHKIVSNDPTTDTSVMFPFSSVHTFSKYLIGPKNTKVHSEFFIGFIQLIVIEAMLSKRYLRTFKDTTYLRQKRAPMSEKRARRSAINKTNPYSLTNHIKRLNSAGSWLLNDYTNCITHLNITSLEIHIGLYLNRIVPAQPLAKVIEMTTIKLE